MVGDPLGDAPPRRLTRPLDPERGRASVLIVEPDVRVGRALRTACTTAADVILCHDFDSGRSALEHATPQVLVTNLRLEQYNGLHLVLLSSTAGYSARSVVHTDRPDFLLIAEALAMGAFFERTDRLLFSIVAYIWGPLPPADRRNPQRIDRRAVFRGGRRVTDNKALAS